MPKSLLEQLPEIVAIGRKQAEKILEGIESRQRVTLQTREVVLPAKDSAAQDWVTARHSAQREVPARHRPSFRKAGIQLCQRHGACAPACAG
ncbi:MAG: hypothetical protein IPN53_00595 [Comamonadaceae bacterium]|nr:hypothetical protein [Comamonadaceae bacterium]